MPSQRNRITLKTLEPSVQESLMAMGNIDSDENLVNRYERISDFIAILNGDSNATVAFSSDGRTAISLSQAINIGLGSTPIEVVQRILNRQGLDSDGDFANINSGNSYIRCPELSDEQKQFIEPLLTTFQQLEDQSKESSQLEKELNVTNGLLAALNGDSNATVAFSSDGRTAISLSQAINIGLGSTPIEVVQRILNRQGLDSDGDFANINSGNSYIRCPELSDEQKQFIEPLLTTFQQLEDQSKESSQLEKELNVTNGLLAALNGDSNATVAFSSDGRTAISLSQAINIGLGSTPIEVVQRILNRQGLDSDGDFANINSGNGYIRCPELSDEQNNIISNALAGQNLGRDSGEFQKINNQFNRLKDDIILQQKFYRLVTENSSFEQLLQYLSNIEERDEKDRVLVSELTAYTFALRRTKFLQQVCASLSIEKPDFDKIFAGLESFGNSPSEKDRAVVSQLGKKVSRYEVSFYEKDILSCSNLANSRKSVLEKIESIPLRPTLNGGVDYVEFAQELKIKVNKLYDELAPIQLLSQTTELRKNFSQLAPDEVFAQIDAIPANSKREVFIKNALLEEYRRSLEAEGRTMTEDVRAQINRRIGVALDGEYSLLELGSNDEAKNYMMQNFGRTFFTLFQSLRGNPAIRKSVEDYIVGKDENGERIRNQFVQSLKELEKQRPLTDIERAYIESVEQLTKFNPYIVGLANESLGITDEFLRNHFDTLSSNTWESLSEGSYVPALQIGTGPNGLSFFGEVARYKPELAAQMLVVDQGKQPGGPFAIPGGPAWELNSANRRGKRQAVIPDKPGKNEAKTVRAYGSPVTRWYPGERRAEEDVRQGGINTTVDYLPTPDELSTLRYPTNEEFQIILASQGAMLFRNITLKTRLEKVAPNTDENQEGEYKVVLIREMADGRTETKTIYTDAVVNSAGLGEDFLGFNLEGSKAEQVLECTKEKEGFPKISSTLKAFESLADRRLENARPPRTIVMNGTGNSTDVMIEYLAELFASGNPLVRNVEKIYIVGTGELSKRPRYARINDVKGRNGKGNLIEFISGRVGDVDFANPETTNPDKEPLVILDESGQALTNNSGDRIEADAFIGNAGFRSRLDEIYSSFLPEDKSLNIKAKDRPTDSITLPTNKEVAVAEQLEGNPNIIFVGTASNPNFDSAEKLAQLPITAREALLRNGAENAVAVGFRAPDSQAAARLFLDQRDLDLPESTNRPVDEILVSMTESAILNWNVPITVDSSKLSVANNVSSEDDMLSALSAYDLAGIKLVDESGQGVTGNIDLSITKSGNEFKIDVDPNSTIPVSEKIISMIQGFVENPYFQNYAISGLKKKRRNPKVSMLLDFRNGCIRPKESLVQVS